MKSNVNSRLSLVIANSGTSAGLAIRQVHLLEGRIANKTLKKQVPL